MVKRIERLVLHLVKTLFAWTLAHMLLLVAQDLAKLLLTLREDGAG